MMKMYCSWFVLPTPFEFVERALHHLYIDPFVRTPTELDLKPNSSGKRSNDRGRTANANPGVFRLLFVPQRERRQFCADPTVGWNSLRRVTTICQWKLPIRECGLLMTDFESIGCTGQPGLRRSGPALELARGSTPPDGTTSLAVATVACKLFKAVLPDPAAARRQANVAVMQAPAEHIMSLSRIVYDLEARRSKPSGALP
jgi:hypothetical protein